MAVFRVGIYNGRLVTIDPNTRMKNKSKNWFNWHKLIYMTLHLQGGSEHVSMFTDIYPYYLQNYLGRVSVPKHDNQQAGLWSFAGLVAGAGFEPATFGL